MNNRPSAEDLMASKQSLNSKTEEILQLKIEWESYIDQHFITRQEFGVFQDYKDSLNEKKQFLEERGQDLASFFVKALTTINAPNPVQFLLAHIDDILTTDLSRAKLFRQLAGPDSNPYGPFIQIFSRSSSTEYATAKAAHILAVLLLEEDARSQSLAEFLTHAKSHLENSKAEISTYILESLKVILRSKNAQIAFVQDGGLRSLANLMRKDAKNTQLQYLIAFCLWLLTFHKENLPLFLKNDVIPKVVDVIKVVTREKVVRVSFALLKNVLNAENFKEAMLSAGLLKVLPVLSNRKWNDDDLVSDLKTIDEALREYVKVLSSFEKYATEVNSGNLEWSPVHNEGFWREYANKFQDDNFSLIKKLVECLDPARDAVTLEVACYDLGEFARFFDGGKRVIDKLDGKKRLMELMKSKDPKVSKQALLAVQKLMVQNWESLNVAAAPK